MSDKTVNIELPILDMEGKLMGLHQSIASATLEDGTEVEVTAGFGLGNAAMSVSLNNRRIITVDGQALLRGLIDAAIKIKEEEG